MFLDLEQGSDEWFEARKGVVTASKIGKCFTKSLKPSAAGIETLASEIVAEGEGHIEEFYQNAHMLRGQELEPTARDLLSFHLDQEIKEVGFYKHTDSLLGCSPDGIIGDMEAGVEIKCPMAKTHIRYCSSKSMPPEYYPQVQYSMYVTGIDVWWFMSFFPGMRPFIMKIEKDEKFFSAINEVLDNLRGQIYLFKEGINE